jgi:hypothetical protein
LEFQFLDLQHKLHVIRAQHVVGPSSAREKPINDFDVPFTCNGRVWKLRTQNEFGAFFVVASPEETAIS